VLSFALPALSADLQPSGTTLLWIVDVYPLVLAGLLVPMGSIGDRHGRRRLLLIGATGFAVLSVASAFAPTAEVLVATRALKAVFGAMLMPSTLSLIRNIFTVDTERRFAIACWAAAYSGGSALGPILGGVLLEHFWWGSTFLLAVPMLLPLLLLAPLLVPESKDPNPGPVDPVSIGLVMISMIPLIWAIKTAAHEGVTPTVVLAAGTGIMAGWWFVRRQLGRPRPMLDVRLFRLPAFSASVSANLLSIFSQVGFLYFISQHLQLVSGLSPLEAGIYLLPGLALTVIAGFAIVPVVRRVDPGKAMAFGLLLNGVGYGVMFLSGWVGGDMALVISYMILGTGIGISETISNDLVLSAVPAHQAGAASAISETAYEIGAVLGTAVLGSILNSAYRGHLDLPGGLDAASERAASETLGGASEVAGTLSAADGSALLTAAQEAFDSGSAFTAIIGVVMMVSAAVMVVLVMRERAPREQPEVAEAA
jgi:DHA2 family multidrug resistance protein-like MFS transporter